MEIFRTIVEVVALVIGILAWVGITPPAIARFFVANRAVVTQVFELSFAVIYTLFLLLFVFVFIPILTRIFNLAWAMLLGIILWSVMGAWLPILRRRLWWTSRQWVNVVYLSLSYALVAFVLIGFWIVSQPDLMMPFILTCAALLTIIFWLVRHIYEDVRRKRSQRR